MSIIASNCYAGNTIHIASGLKNEVFYDVHDYFFYEFQIRQKHTIEPWPLCYINMFNMKKCTPPHMAIISTAIRHEGTFNRKKWWFQRKPWFQSNKSWFQSTSHDFKANVMTSKQQLSKLQWVNKDREHINEQWFSKL